LAPRDSRLFNELGILYADAGDPARAVAGFRRAVELDPAYARAWNNLGNAERVAGHASAAEAAFEHASRADPRYALAWANLGALRRERGEDAGAETALARALEIDPQQRVALLALAGLRRQQGAVDAAIALYTRAVQRDPRDANAFFQLAGTLAERDDLAAARQAYDAAFARDAGLLRALLGRHLTLPMVPASVEAVAQARARYATGLEALARELPQRAAALPAERVVDELRWTNFLLAYQGDDDRALQSRYGDLASGVAAERAPQWAGPVRARAEAPRIRVGFVSAFFRDGTAGRYFEHWITGLARDRFEVHVYHLAPGSDALTQRIAARADAFHHCLRWRPAQLAARLETALGEIHKLSGQVAALGGTIESLGMRLHQAEVQRAVPAPAPAAASVNTRGYETAIRMARSGASVEEIVASCGTTRAEAKLLRRLHECGDPRRADAEAMRIA